MERRKKMENKKEPVFCTNCGHGRGEEWGGISCKAFTIRENTYKGVKFTAPNPAVLNKNCDCKYFVPATNGRKFLIRLGQLT